MESKYKKIVHMDTVIIRALAFLATGFALAIVFGIIGYVFARGLPAVNWKFLTSEKSYLDEVYGIKPQIINTLYITLLSLLIVLPVGVGGAVYLSEYSKQGRVLHAIRFIIEILSGIPSIVYGLFGTLFFVTFFQMGTSLLAGAFTLAIIVLPIVVRTTEESLKAVDPTYREAALSMGVDRLYTIRTVLLPCAMPGIISAVILSVGRMVGESAALICTSGIDYHMPDNLLTHYKNSGATLSIEIYQCCTESREWMAEETPFAIAAVLMLVVLALNFLTYAVGKKVKKG